MLKNLTFWRESKDSKHLLGALDSIFLDEVHERSFNMDIILGCLKEMDAKGQLDKFTKIILASATINEGVF